MKPYSPSSITVIVECFLSRCLVFFLSLIMLIPLSIAQSQQPRARYVFLFIGDGMGLGQIYASQIYLNSLDASSPIGYEKKLHMLRLKNLGLVTNYSQDSFITDSAAAASALATGFKTSNGMINIDPLSHLPRTSIASKAQGLSFKIGIISNTALTDATPSAFFAHSFSRNDWQQLLGQMAHSGFDFFGGGATHASPQHLLESGEDSSLSILFEHGYRLFLPHDLLTKNLSQEPGKIVALDPILAPSGSMHFSIDQISRGSTLTLDFLTQKAVEKLESKSGFFLVVEGGKIDWACHANDAATMIGEVLAFDAAIGKALEFYKKNPRETLIIVTGDHETGGMGLGSSAQGYHLALQHLKNQKISTWAFSELMRKEIKIRGPNVKLKELMPLIKDNFGLSPPPHYGKTKESQQRLGRSPSITESQELVLSDLDLKRLEDALNWTLDHQETSESRGSQESLLYGSYDPVAVTVSKILGEKSGVSWGTYFHTGIPVAIFAVGSGSDLFQGIMDNTEIYSKLDKIISNTP